MAEETARPFAGVVLFGESVEDLKAVELACKRLPVSAEYKLCIIHVTELNADDTNNPPLEPREYNKYDEIENMLLDVGYERTDVGRLQDNIPVHVEKHILGKEYKGQNFERTLQIAINDLTRKGLDILVLRWWKPNDQQRMPVNKLESNGCSIVLANVDSTSNVVNLAMGGAGAGAGAADGAGAGAGAGAAGGAAEGPAAAGSSTGTTSLAPVLQPPMARQTPTSREQPGPSNPSKTKNKTKK